MRALLWIVIAAALLPGCTKEVWHRQEVVDWSEMWVRPPVQLRYCGSDANWHYFTARPVDDTCFIKVARNEISIADEEPKAKLGEWYYPVDPAHDFRRIPE